MLSKEDISKYINPLFPLPTSLERMGKLEKKIRCILFDIYGTLFISGSGDIGVLKQEIHNMPLIKDLLIKYNISSDSQSIIEAFYHAIEIKHRELREKGVDYPEVQIDLIWMDILQFNDILRAREFAIEFEMVTNPVYPMPNLQKMLTFLKNKNIHMGIISNAQFYTPYLFEWFLDSSIDALEFNEKLSFFSYKEGFAKPSSHLFHLAAKALNEMGISFDNVLYIGNDMRSDVLPAKEMGFKTALFAGDTRSLRLRNDISKCREVSPDLIITDLYQLCDFV